MTGTTRYTTKTARRRIPKGRRAVKIVFCVEGHGSLLPGMFECRPVTDSIPHLGTITLDFGVAGKCFNP
jgi:hypothetical protein